MVTVDNLVGTGTPDPQIGYWAGNPGADGQQSLTVALNSVKVSGNILAATDFSLTQNLDGSFSGTILADLDNNAANGKETLNFDLDHEQ